SAQAAVAVKTSRLFEEESESRHIAEALRAVAEQLVRPEGLESSLRVVSQIIAEVLDAVFVHVALADPSSVGLPVPEDGHDRAEVISVGRRVLGADGRATVVHRGKDSGADSLLAIDPRAAALLVVPIALESDHGAIMAVALTEGADAGETILIGESFADEIALALDNAYLYERALARAANLENIFRISQVVGSSLQVNVVLNRVLDVVQKILSADGVVLWAYDRRKRALGSAMVRGNVPTRFVGLELGAGEDLPGRVFASRQPVAIADLDVSMGGLAESAAQENLRSLIAVPLLARGRAVGVLMVLSARRGAFSDEDMSILQTFASQAALAIDTARMYSREHEVATVLQQSILPEALARFDYVTVSSVYAPAGADIEIGGDYYDVFSGPDGCTWFVIADVCGKGVHAATKTSMIKYAVRALVAAGKDPGEAIGEVNRMVHNSGAISDIVTLWVGRHDGERQEIEWADGGHPPALLRRVDGEIEALGTTGPLLGAAADVVYGVECSAFKPGDRIVLYTDGVTEARNDGVFFGEERVREFLSTDVRAEDAARTLLETVRGFVRADLRDDVAILVVESRGSRVDMAADLQQEGRGQ
ncbi:MAG: GAF domain-containing protein, partial [Actinobacteria bacterium]